MTNYCLSVVRRSEQNDGLTKPKSDINRILKSLGFLEIKQDIFKNKKQKIVGVKKAVNAIVNNLKSKDSMIIHYPTDMGILFDYCLLKELHKKHVKPVAFIHDIDALRFKVSFYKRLRYEVNLLNKFACLVSPNQVMTDKLKKEGLKVPVVNLQLFDYLTDQNMHKKKIQYSHKVSFTGNLNKADFIFNLKNSQLVTYDFYGPIKRNVHLISDQYVGSYPSDELLMKVNSGFGLIWDGDNIKNIDTSVISSGSYLQYNNPYKLSFYIAAGIPIIIWNRAAEAEFVRKNKIGFTVSSLTDIDKIMKDFNSVDYYEMSDKVKIIQDRVLDGNYTKEAIKKVLHVIE